MAPSLRGIQGIHHVGISVRNLRRSLEFYCDVLRMELIAQDAFSGDAMDRITSLPATSGHSAMLRAGTQHLELFEFASPSPEFGDSPRPVCDHGISHFCLQVTDIHGEYERLKAAGVEFHCAPQRFGEMLATYARDPDGNVFELLEIPERE